MNVACHLAEMGVNTTFISCVGRDRLGLEARRRLKDKNVRTELLSVCDTETGFVEASVDLKGDATYTFITPAAWDFVPSEGIAEAAASCDAVVFGTLAQRSSMSRAAVQVARDAAKYTVCDVNLRPPYTDDKIVAESVLGVDCLKLNDQELVTLLL